MSTSSSASALLEEWCARLSGSPRVVLAEGDDPRVRQAADELTALGLVPVLVSRDGDGGTSVSELAAGVAGDVVRRIGATRGWSEEVTEQRAHSPLHLAAALVAAGEADTAVAGSLAPTGDVIRAGLQVVGLRADTPLLSSSFLLVLPDGRALAFGDCAVVPEPFADQLASIAVDTARTFTTLTGRDARVAMLSFSTRGSAEHETVRRVRAATERARELAPDLVVDGELQFDAAVAASVAAQKAPGSSVAGQANVLVFPDLNAGNIGYKIAQRLGGAQAFGPILQGLRAPMNDLSRGCDAADIVNVSVISALQAQALAEERVPHPA